MVVSRDERGLKGLSASLRHSVRPASRQAKSRRARSAAPYLLTPPHISERPQCHHQSHRAQPDDERFARDEAKVHEQITAKSAAEQPHKASANATGTAERGEEQSEAQIDPHVVANQRVTAVLQRVLKQRGDRVRDGQHFEPFACAPQVKARRAFGKQHHD